MNIWELQDSQNIEPELDEELSKKIAREAIEGYKIDKQSRREWEQRMENANKLALQVKEEKTWPWPNASNVKFPLVTIAALQFSARAYPALIKGPDLVKYRVTGRDEDGAKAARAQRVSTHMSYQLLEEDEDWEEDADKSFVVIPIAGCAFKKSFFDPVLEHNVSRLVLPKNLVVSYYTKTIEKCERKTEELELSERAIKIRQLKGLFSTKELGEAKSRDTQDTDERQGLTEPTGDSKKTRPILEQHAWLDLDEDGLEEPYVITIDESSEKLLRIVSRFGEVETEQSVALKALTDRYKTMDLEIQDIIAQVPPPQGQEDARALEALQQAEQQIMQIKAQQEQLTAQMMQLAEDNKTNPMVLEVNADEHYTKYGFIPSPDGGFYDLGLGALLGPLNDSVNTLVNQLTDSGTLSNGSHGFIGRGARIEGGKIRFTDPFEWKRVNVAGQTLRESIVPLPVNQPSAVLFNLLGLLISYSERVSSVNDTMVGQNPGQNTPAFNYQNMLEQGMQVFNGIFKRCYRSFRKELKKLYLLNRAYLNPIDYYETVGGQWKIMQSDYAGDERHIRPAADPNAFSSTEKLMKASFLAERSTLVPGYNMARVEMKLLQAMDIPDIQDVFPIDEKGQPMIQPPGNPEVELKAADLQRKTLESKARQETNAFLADIKAMEAQSTVILNQVKANSLSTDDAVKRFNAISERIEKRREQHLKEMELEIEREAQQTEGRAD